jgi:hypothetical protein
MKKHGLPGESDVESGVVVNDAAGNCVAENSGVKSGVVENDPGLRTKKKGEEGSPGPHAGSSERTWCRPRLLQRVSPHQGLGKLRKTQTKIFLQTVKPFMSRVTWRRRPRRKIHRTNLTFFLRRIRIRSTVQRRSLLKMFGINLHNDTKVTITS